MTTKIHIVYTSEKQNQIADVILNDSDSILDNIITLEKHPRYGYRIALPKWNYIEEQDIDNLILMLQACKMVIKNQQNPRSGILDVSPVM